MKKYIYSFVLLGILGFQGFTVAQTTVPSKLQVDSKQYEQLKKEGKLPANFNISNPKSFTPSLEDLKRVASVHHMAAGSACSCYVTPDATYTVAMAPNDDGSTGAIPIPFTFCLYGVNWNSLFINNNGNISFGASYFTFSSFPFPDPGYTMVAPFWGDVDTRGTGTVYYKITPTAMYINWEAVGYYSMMTDKVNTFQLIITNGADPILPSGDNIAFCYGDMQWTTGAASSGIGGFGGTPATVGLNQGGAGGSYLQIGRFDQPGAAYDGGYGANDGVSWLDNQSFYFNSCTGSNIAPIVSGLSNCDTLKICGLGDTLILDGLFLSPEIGQITSIDINLNSTPGASIIVNDTGNSADGQVMIIASAANAGNNVITFTATDNGSPAGITTINVNVYVDTTGLAAFNPVIGGVLQFCEGDSTTLNVTPTTFDSYFWNTGSTGTSIVADSGGLYWVTTHWGACAKTTSVNVVEHPKPTPSIAGATFTCGINPTIIYIDSASIYSSYVWSNASTNDSVTTVSGTYSVTVTDAFGCVGTSPPVTIVNANPAVTIIGNQQFCPGDSILLTANPTLPAGVSYLWSTSAITQSDYINSAGTYIVGISYVNGCSAADTVTVSLFNAPTADFSSTPAGTSPPAVPVSFTNLSSIPTPPTIITWNWNFGDSLGIQSTAQNPSHTYAIDGTYHVTLAVQSSNGCWDTIKYDYVIASDIEVPNIFTPNGDHKNDVFAFKNLEFFPGCTLQIYNRWGKKIYEKADYANDWDGSGFSDGVYFFVLSGPKLKETKYGNVQILR